MVLKRFFDIFAAVLGMLILSPLLLPIMVLIWLQDFHSPFYIAPRMAMGSGTFRMVKLRSMVINANRAGINSTAADDRRITTIGRLVRKTKLDELSQLWNVLKGDMSIVGPRPQVKADADLYTIVERGILSARPGITDLASIVFSDEGGILAGSDNPDLRYNQIIRPWKSRLALLYIEKRNFAVDLRIIWMTVLAVFSKHRALEHVNQILDEWNADQLLRRMASRSEPLLAFPPPGGTEVVAHYP